MHVTGAERTVTVSQEAIRYAAMYADPNLELFEQEKIPTTTKDTKLTDHLYRYVNFAEVGGFGKATDDEKDELAKKLVDTGFFSKMEPVDIQVKKHEVNNYIIYQTYEVEVSYDLKMPIGVIFGGEIATLHMNTREEAPVTDTAEFIRTVDMAIDYAERSKSGEKFVNSINEVYLRVDEFVNGTPYTSDDAVAGGVKKLPEYHLTTAPDRSKFKHGYDEPSSKLTPEERIRYSPKCSYGHYEEGEDDSVRGNGLFIPNDQTIFEDVLFPGEGVKNEAGQYGVVYKDGIPDFSPYAIGEVKIENMTGDRYTKETGNFAQADAKLAEQWGCEPEQVADWRDKNDYTWHELNDTETMQLVPFKLNKTCIHIGGTSEAKR